MNFGEHDINPNKKDKAWIARFIKKAWKDYIDYNPNVFYNHKESIYEVRRYMRGDQSIAQYKTRLVPRDIAEEDNTWLRIDWKVLPVIPKLRRIALEIIRNQRYDINVDVIDSLAKEEQDEYYAEKASKILLRQEFEKQGVDPSLIGMEDTDPQTIEELEILMEYHYKSRVAIEVETFLRNILTRNRYTEETRDKLIADLFDLGTCVTRDSVDYDGEILAEYIDPETFVVSYCEDTFFQDADYMGQVLTMSPIEIKKHLNEEDEFDFKQLEAWIEEQQKSARSPYSKKENFDAQQLRVLHLEFKSSNKEEFEFRTTKDGAKVMGKKSKGKKNKEFTDGEFEVIYEGYWIIDSPFFFSCNKATNMKRHPEDLKETSYTYHPYAPNMYRMGTDSIGRQMIPIADQIQMVWYKLQNAIAKSRPNGVLYEISALQDINVGGAEITPQENISFFNLTGSLAYRRVDEDGQVTNYKPIEDLQGGMGAYGQELFSTLFNFINMLRDTVGLNEVTDGSSIDPKMLKSVAQAAQLSSNNSLRYIHEAEKKMTDRLCTDIMLRIQDMAEEGNIDYYEKSLGKNTVEFFSLNKNISFRRLGIFFEEEPPQEEKERLDAMINAALTTPANGGDPQLTIDQASYLRTIQTTKMAMAYLAYMVKKNKEEARKQAMEMQQMNAQVQQQSTMVSEEEKRKTAEMEARLDIMKIDREWEWRMQVAQLESQREITEEQIKAAARDREASQSNNTKQYIANVKEGQSSDQRDS